MTTLIDRTCEGNETPYLALDFGLVPMVPPLGTRVDPWDYDREMYQRRSEIERLSRRLKGFSRTFPCFEKLGVLCLGLISFARIINPLL